MKMFKKVSLLFLSLCLVFGMAACGNNNDQEETSNTDVQNAKPVILAVSFGSSYNDTRDNAIGGVEKAIQAAYPDYEVRRAFTAQTIIDILAERENIKIDNVTEAMQKLIQEGVKEVIIQPTHVMKGLEYDDVVAEVKKYEDMFDKMKIGDSLLTKQEDYDQLANILVEETKQYDQEGTAIVFMGHGTTHSANSTYAKFDKTLKDAGHANYFVGTVEATPSLEDIIADVKAYGAKKVVLLPLMVVAGDHANNDMAGDEEGSWKTEFTKAGFEVECVLKGMGEYKAVQDMYVQHVKEAMEKADPITADKVKEGSYEITMKSSSSMFRAEKVVLDVKDGKMNVTLTMPSDSYGKLFLGKGDKAPVDSDENCIMPVLNEQGNGVFTFEINKLNDDIDCAAWSRKKAKWYDRTLVFESTNIPAEAISLDK